MISFKEEDKKFNFRVGAIIISTDKKKVLLHTIEGFDFYLLPGGRVEWMEYSVDAIKRELLEEIGLKNIEPKERLMLENFFYFKGVEFQEVSVDFVIELNEKNNFIENNDEFFGLEGEKYIYKWVNISELDNYLIKPNILVDTIKNYKGNFEYKILEGRK